MNPSVLSRAFVSLALLAVLSASVATPLAAAPRARADVPTAPLRRAYDLLLDRYVHPLLPEALLTAAWQGAQHVAGSEQPAPSFSGDRQSDWAAFESALLEVAASSDADGGAIAAAAISAMAQSVNEGHTYYLDHAAYQDYLNWIRGDVHYSGVGIRIDRETLVILEVFDNSPAQVAGLLTGDTILAVDGRAADGEAREQVIDRIRGENGTAVTLTIARKGEAGPLDILMFRAEVHVNFVRSTMLPGKVGYIYLRGFADHQVAQDFEDALDALRADGATSVVIDLRGNSGGRVDVGSRLLSLFVENGPLYQQLDRSGAPVVNQAQGGYRQPSLPLAVLVDGGTASMGEIFAAAIQDHGLGPVIGTTTAGSVAAAQVYSLQDGSGIQITVLEITSAHGRALNVVGVAPDQVVEQDVIALQDGHDVQLEAAIQAIQPSPMHALGSGYRQLALAS